MSHKKFGPDRFSLTEPSGPNSSSQLQCLGYVKNNKNNDNNKLQCFTKTLNSQKYKNKFSRKICLVAIPNDFYIRWISIMFDTKYLFKNRKYVIQPQCQFISYNNCEIQGLSLRMRFQRQKRIYTSFPEVRIFSVPLDNTTIFYNFTASTSLLDYCATFISCLRYIYDFFSRELRYV